MYALSDVCMPACLPACLHACMHACMQVHFVHTSQRRTFGHTGRCVFGQVVVVDMHNNNAVNKRPMKAEARLIGGSCLGIRIVEYFEM